MDKAVLSMAEIPSSSFGVTYSQLVVALSRTEGGREDIRWLLTKDSNGNFRYDHMLKYLTKLKPDKNVLSYLAGFPKELGSWSVDKVLPKYEEFLTKSQSNSSMVETSEILEEEAVTPPIITMPSSRKRRKLPSRN